MAPDPVFIGLDPTAGKRPIHYAALDRDLKIVAQGAGKFDEVVDMLTGYPSAVVAIDAPQSPNQGLMADPARRQQLGLQPHGKGWSNCKVCEYQLRQRGIGLYLTPRDIASAQSWTRMGFQLYAALRAEGFQIIRPGLEAERIMLEVHPHGCFTVLLGHRPLRKDTLEGRLQRQIVLYDEGIDVRDPLDAVEELTRHHLRQGTLSFPGLHTHDELDALVAAYTAYVAARHPEQVTPVGDPDEGQIILPVAPADFKERYR
jgi:predicted nuclease with RNAse H fold